jgi:hypothetical protein
VTEAAPVNATPANPESANFRLEYRSKTNGPIPYVRLRLLMAAVKRDK